MLNEWYGILSCVCYAGLRGLDELFVFRSPVERVLRYTPLLIVLQ
jgi:hypothetical protein